MNRMLWARTLFLCLPWQFVPCLRLNQFASENQRTVKVFELSTEYGYGHGKPIKFSNEACAVNCDYVDSFEEANVIFSNVGKSKVQRLPGSEKIWVGTFWESVQHYPALSQDYDYTISYRPDASFPNFAMIWDTARNISLQKVRTLVPYEIKRSLLGETAVLISNCGMDKTGRLQLAEAMKSNGLTMDSYGSCHHNKDESKDAATLLAALPESKFDYIRQWVGGGSTGLASVSGHLFTFAAENSVCAYYHTEKVFRALMAGSVPIYVGATTIYEYVPTNSIIMASDFKDLKELFSFLRDVRDDRTKYESYLAWRESELPIKLQEKLDAERTFGKSEWACNMCKVFHRGRPQSTVPSETVGCKPSSKGVGLTKAGFGNALGRYPQTAEALRNLIGDA